MKPERKARILVIDDEEGIRKSLKMILEYEGYEFFEASTGEDGLDEAPGDGRARPRPPRHQDARAGRPRGPGRDSGSALSSPRSS